MRKAARQFLARAGWENEDVMPVAGDLSARHYFRLSQGGTTAILMDAHPDAASTHAFQAMTNWLTALDLSVPQIHFAAPDDGLLLLEDFGNASAGQMIVDGMDASEIYRLCIPLLLTIRRAAPPALERPSAKTLCDWTKLADTHYPGADCAGLTRFRAVLETVLSEFVGENASVSLRDFHVDNMMWLPGRKGCRQLGLLDYQDAFLTHPVYDLVSLLTDARTSVPREVRAEFIQRYAEMSGDDADELARAFAAFSVQRNLRILGIFHRAAADHGKPHHADKIPRVFGYLTEALEHPVFDDARDTLINALPMPEGVT